ncbi:heme exporter protein CcmD [Aurantimonas sp. VKM B-3413]|uniref:heme exporter protein CcmD n=1 Tax=Aurantimonas sp. VKM B-3413 TaxID=2779401 RepID=UPI001E28E58B|nr:heme exporter protein CcmD [Aurantimonas sp. VKM B-3413]MCB8839196.1 heme exporter protein CcmD [Aurantimonas sp. VKM B-3413]
MQHDYFGFIASAYGLSALGIVALGLWVFFDARVQRRALKTLEAQGIRRRSAGRDDRASGAAGAGR